jgi:hypothetical protein
MYKCLLCNRVVFDVDGIKNICVYVIKVTCAWLYVNILRAVDDGGGT